MHVAGVSSFTCILKFKLVQEEEEEFILHKQTHNKRTRILLIAASAEVSRAKGDLWQVLLVIGTARQLLCSFTGKV